MQKFKARWISGDPGYWYVQCPMDGHMLIAFDGDSFPHDKVKRHLEIRHPYLLRNLRARHG